METEQKTDRARVQAAAQADSITAMLERLDHAQRCHARLGESWSCGARLGGHPSLEELREYHDEGAAREDIDLSPLSVEVRSGWTALGAECDPYEFRIVLSTGGPAVQIRGEIGSDGEPCKARLEYQDWGTPWVQYTDDHRPGLRDALLGYSRHFID